MKTRTKWILVLSTTVGIITAVFAYFFLIPNQLANDTCEYVEHQEHNTETCELKCLEKCEEQKQEQFTYGPLSCDDTCPYERGVCFFGRCFCRAGFFGPRCKYNRLSFGDLECSNIISNINDTLPKPKPTCTKQQVGFRMKNAPTEKIYSKAGVTPSDICEWMCNEDETGVTVPTKENSWEIGNNEELDSWGSSKALNDRLEENVKNFAKYRNLPDDLGELIEIGCGPFTHTLGILKNGKKVSKLTLADPFLTEYMKKVKNCRYKNGELNGISANLISLKAEDLVEKFGGESFDTVVMVNVLEHTNNPLKVLESAYDLLRPNGIFVFHDRSFPDSPSSILYRDIGWHPMHVSCTLIDHFVKSMFETLYVHVSFPGYVINYFIGKKRPLHSITVYK